jgi:hypothetical protein
MRNGAVLRLEYTRTRSVWTLNDGLPIGPEIVSLLLACAAIEPAHDSLFTDAPSQTWRMKAATAPALPTERCGLEDNAAKETTNV